jgi:hypothetical protein
MKEKKLMKRGKDHALERWINTLIIQPQHPDSRDLGDVFSQARKQC